MALAVILAAGYGLAVNLLAFALFGLDKRRAAAGAWRIREATLIGVALAGGWLGAKAGQRRFRHKTRKQPFAKRLNSAGLVPLGLLVILFTISLAPPAAVSAGADWAVDTFVRIVSDLASQGLPSEHEPEARPLPTRFGPGSGDGM